MMSDRPNTYASDAAREAANMAFKLFRLSSIVPTKYSHLENNAANHRGAMDAAIDAFLSKALEGADEKLAEIVMALREFAIAERKRHSGKMNVYEATLADRAADTIALLVHKCHMHAVARKHIAEDFARREDELSAKLKEVEAKHNILNGMWLAAEEENDKLEAQLTAQKASHAKLLRDEADKLKAVGYREEDFAAGHLRRLAEKIEGGE